MENPRQLVHAAFYALKSRDYNGLASLCDPLSLASFKQEMVDEYCPALSTADDQHTHPPVELSEEEYAELVDVLDPVARMQSEFPTIRSLDQLISMDPIAVFATWMYASSAARFQDKTPRRPWEISSEWKPGEDQHRDSEPTYAIIGCVFASPDIAHVLYHNELSALESSPGGYGKWLSEALPVYRDFMNAMHHRGTPSLITCRRQSDGSWRLVARKDFMSAGTLGVTFISDENEP